MAMRNAPFFCILAQRSSERRLIGLLFAVTFALRLLYVFHYPIDSDEPQHLHVVWGWTQGFLPYRDVFDNHMPLFHLLYAPLLAVIGERSSVLPLMRLGMLPLYAFSLWSIFRLGAAVWSWRVGSWAAVFAGLLPGYFLCSVEFRTDDLWTALWLGFLVVLVSKQLSRQRSFVAGVLLGATLSVSMKTVLMFGALAAGGIAALCLFPTYRTPLALRRLGGYGSVLLAGASLLPLCVCVLFWSQDAFQPFLYGVVQHNMLPGLGLWSRNPGRIWFFPLGLLVLWWGTRWSVQQAPDSRRGARRAFICFTAGFYFLALESFWPLLTREDYLPFYPLLTLLLTPPLLTMTQWPANGWEAPVWRRVLAWRGWPALVASGELVLLLGEGTPWRDGARAEAELLAETLQLTQPSDPVMDLKGESVFRRRPFFYVLEGITKARIKRGLLNDSIPEALVATHTCVAVADSDQLPPRARAFLRENYVPVGHLRVAGRVLSMAAHGDEPTIMFEVRIPASYAVITAQGEASGWLDDSPYQGPRFLAPGHHTYRPALGEDTLAVVWAQAVERGFTPFVSRGALS
jgi:hypothetical protein